MTTKLVESTETLNNMCVDAKGDQVAALSAALETLILDHGYEVALFSIESAWSRREMTWPAYQQLKSIASNVNAQIERSLA